MRATGIIRRLDDLGRIVIPKEIRRSMSIHENDALEIFVEGDGLILIPYRPDYIQALKVAQAGIIGALGIEIDWKDSKALNNAFDTIEKIVKKIER